MNELTISEKTWAQDGHEMGTGWAREIHQLVSTSLVTKVFTGAPNRSRTCDLWLRKPTLYPTELWARGVALYQTAHVIVHYIDTPFA